MTKRTDGLCDYCLEPDPDGVCTTCARRSITSIHTVSQGVYRLELKDGGFDYEAVVLMDLGGTASLRSLMRLGSKREMRHGMMRSHLREIATSFSQKRYRAWQNRKSR